MDAQESMLQVSMQQMLGMSPMVRSGYTVNYTRCVSQRCRHTCNRVDKRRWTATVIHACVTHVR